MWYRSWLEVRWRAVLMLLLNGCIAALLLDDPASAEVWRRRLSGNLPIIFAMNGIVLAGSGIASQLSQRPGQLVHPSMMFLLSLPITRARLVLVRLATGALTTLALLLLTLLVFVLFAPDLRGLLTPRDALLFVLATALMVLAAYSVSGLLSTVLDQLWQTYGAMAIVAGVLGIFPAARFWSVLLRERAASVAPAALTGNELVTLFGGMAVCLCVMVAAAAAAVRIVKHKQF